MIFRKYWLWGWGFMNHRSNIGKSLALGVATLWFVGCAGSLKPTSVVQTNLEQDRYTPEQSISKAAVLDAYKHHLPLPLDAPLSISVMSQHDSFLKEGGSTVVQIGLSSSTPKLGVSHIHFLILPPRQDAKDTLAAAMNAMIDAIRVEQKRLPAGSDITMDWSYVPPKINASFPALNKEFKADNLEAMLKQVLFTPFVNGKHHFVLVVGEHGNLTAAQQQNVVDMAEVLVNRGSGVSVLTLGEKPDVAFLSKLSATGDGTFDLLNTEMALPRWFSDVIDNMNAARLKDIIVTLNFPPRVTLGTKWISDQFTVREQKIIITLPELKQGREKVYLVEVTVPQEMENATSPLVNANVRYFDTGANKFFNTEVIKNLVYTTDRNLALASQNASVLRSLAILKTSDTLNEVANTLRDKRPYKGIAVLSKQAQSLRALGEPSKDDELLRDARVLDRYAQQLLSSTGEALQSLKLFRDLTWDTARYRNAPQ